MRPLPGEGRTDYTSRPTAPRCPREEILALLGGGQASEDAEVALIVKGLALLLLLVGAFGARVPRLGELVVLVVATAGCD